MPSALGAFSFLGTCNVVTVPPSGVSSLRECPVRRCVISKQTIAFVDARKECESFPLFRKSRDSGEAAPMT